MLAIFMIATIIMNLIPIPFINFQFVKNAFPRAHIIKTRYDPLRNIIKKRLQGFLKANEIDQWCPTGFRIISIGCNHWVLPRLALFP